MTKEDIENYRKARERSRDLRDVDITMIGDRSTILDTILLLQYIRHAVNSSEPIDINVRIGHNVSQKSFDFMVNNEMPDDMVPKTTIYIN